MSLMDCGNIVDFALFVFTKPLYWKAQKSNTWGFYSYICPAWELKQDNQSYENRYKEIEDNILCNLKKHDSYKELHNFNFLQPDEDEDYAEFSIIAPVLIDLD